MNHIEMVLSAFEVNVGHSPRADNVPDASCVASLHTNIIVSHPGATLSQLSDSGQTLSEDSGVDIAEAGGLSKDGSPRPSKNQQGHLEQPGPHVPPSGATRQVRASRCHKYPLHQVIRFIMVLGFNLNKSRLSFLKVT